MNILIAYGTNSGGTKLASELIGQTLSARGHHVAVAPANLIEPETFPDYDLVILGSCTWGHRVGTEIVKGDLQLHMLALKQKISDRHVRLPGRKFAVFALGDRSYDHYAEAADHLRQLVDEIGGQLIVEPLRLNKYAHRRVEGEQEAKQWAEAVARALAAP